MLFSINVRDYRRGNQKFTIQRNWKHRAHNMKKNTTQYVTNKYGQSRYHTKSK
jgi:hypothetical protein